jgi:hypothetical protein
LPLSFIASDGDVLELVSGAADGVLELELELDGDDGGVLGVDFDVDGDGVTTGGVVDDGFDSRWQPAIPSARPVQSSMTKVLLIVISRSGLKEGCNDGISRFDAMKQLERGVRARGFLLNKQSRLHLTTPVAEVAPSIKTHERRANCTALR